jgi:predicted nucleic acid-binding Zn ribbon protein
MRQTSRLIDWAIVGLIVLGVLLHFFGPAELETDEFIVIALLILALIAFRVWLRRDTD